jgi:hypothetical protein
MHSKSAYMTAKLVAGIEEENMCAAKIARTFCNGDITTGDSPGVSVLEFLLKAHSALTMQVKLPTTER